MKKKNFVPVDRWELGIEHDPRSVETYKKIVRIDCEYFGDSFGFKSGGDGDNGETLMYIFDAMFEEDDFHKEHSK